MFNTKKWFHCEQSLYFIKMRKFETEDADLVILTIATDVMTNSTDLERSKLKVVVLFEEMEQVEDNTCVAAIDHQEQVMLIQHTKLTENKKYNSVTACRITLILQ